MIIGLKSAFPIGLSACLTTIEVDVAEGLPQFVIVGLPDQSVKEARERVKAAIKNSGFPFPQAKITVNLAPADLKKEGPFFDLPIALGILAASGFIPPKKLAPYLSLGELALDGTLRPFRGALLVTTTFKEKFSFLIPFQNADEASLEKTAYIIPLRSLQEAVEFLRGEKNLMPHRGSFDSIIAHSPFQPSGDFSEVQGQAFAKRALEISASGFHNLLMVGPPGAGKTMLAARLPSILPPLQSDEILEIAKIYTAAGLQADLTLSRRRPFQAPHPTTSQIALIGGGPSARPGQISLAHLGVLFLDEFPEFRRDAIEALRMPLEEGSVTICRAKVQIRYPARFLLIAGMNPCPCGFFQNPHRLCRCSALQIQKYHAKISGPILDRIDLHVEVNPPSASQIFGPSSEESSEAIRERVVMAWEVQNKRFPYKPFPANSLMTPQEIKAHCQLEYEAEQLLKKAFRQFALSVRAYHKILKVARTVADLSTSKVIKTEHIAEALQYRNLSQHVFAA